MNNQKKIVSVLLICLLVLGVGGLYFAYMNGYIKLPKLPPQSAEFQVWAIDATDLNAQTPVGGVTVEGWSIWKNFTYTTAIADPPNVTVYSNTTYKLEATWSVGNWFIAPNLQSPSAFMSYNYIIVTIKNGNIVGIEFKVSTSALMPP